MSEKQSEKQMSSISPLYIVDMMLWLEEEGYVLSPTKGRQKKNCYWSSTYRTPLYWIYPEETKKDPPRFAGEKPNLPEDYAMDGFTFPLPIACLAKIGKRYCVSLENQKYFKTEKYHNKLEEVVEDFFSNE